MKRTPITLLIGFAVIVITSVLYGLFLRGAFFEAISLITLLGTILAETVTTVFAYCSEGRPRKVVAAIVSSVMIPISVILSFVYILGFPYSYGTYCGLYFVFFVIVMIVTAIIFFFDASKKEENQALQDAKGNMLTMRKIVKAIMLNPAAKPYEAKLYALEEKLHFSNDSVITNQDQTIYNMIIFLQNSISLPGFDANAYIDGICNAIDTRNIMSSRNV